MNGFPINESMGSTSAPGPRADLWRYLLISSLINLATWVLVLLPNYLQNQGWTARNIGLAMGAYFMVNLVSQILAGHIADRIGNIATALIGASVAAAGALFYLGCAWFPGLVFPARLFHGAGAGLISSAALIELTKTVPVELKGRIIGYFGLPGFVMIGLGPAICEWLVYTWGFGATFLLILIVFLLTAWLLARLPRSYDRPSGLRQPFLAVVRATFVPLQTILIFSTMFGLCHSSWNSFLAPAVRHLGTGAVSSFGTGYACGAIFTRLGFSHRLDTRARRLTGVGMLLPFAVCLGLIPFASAAWQLALIGLGAGMGHGIFYPSLSSIAAERFHPLFPGQGMSLYVSASGFGLFAGPPIWGMMVDEFSYRAVFVTAAIVMAVSTVTFIVSERGKKS